MFDDLLLSHAMDERPTRKAAIKSGFCMKKENPGEDCEMKVNPINLLQRHNEPFQMCFDATGCFHWCSSRSIEECTLTRETCTMTMFTGHIIVALFADDDSPLLGLRLVTQWSVSWPWPGYIMSCRNLVMPLRASNIPYNDLRHVVLLGNMEFIKRWPCIWFYSIILCV